MVRQYFTMLGGRPLSFGFSSDSNGTVSSTRGPSTAALILDLDIRAFFWYRRRYMFRGIHQKGRESNGLFLRRNLCASPGKFVMFCAIPSLTR